MDDFRTTLKKNIIERLQLAGVTPADVGDNEALFGSGLGLDSIDAVELVVMLEKQYGIRLTDLEEARAAFETIETLAKYILDRPSAAGTPGAT